MSNQTYQQRGNQNSRMPVSQRRMEGGRALEDNRAAFSVKQLKLGETAQRVEKEDELLKGKSGTTQLAQKDEEGETDQTKLSVQVPLVQREAQPSKPNNTGLPDKLKNGIESLSGLSMDNVKVHYNSVKPRQLNALAYAQGTDIHVGPGQEKHLPHEAWHVVQQAQGRVRPTMQMKEGVPVNDDKELEREADMMGEKLAKVEAAQAKESINSSPISSVIIQRVIDDWVREAIMDDAENIAAALRNPPSQQTAWHVMLDYLRRLGIDQPTAADVQPLLQEVLRAVPENTGEAPQVDGAVLVHKEDNLYVYLDSHQNKHQHSKSMITELGTWTAKKGTLFAEGEGLEWHMSNTAITIGNWAKAQTLVKGKKLTPKKTPMDDGIIYDATVELDDSGLIIVIYHCNPTKNR